LRRRQSCTSSRGREQGRIGRLGICTKRQRPDAGGKHQNNQREADHGKPRSAGDVGQLLCPKTLNNNTTSGKHIAASSTRAQPRTGSNRGFRSPFAIQMLSEPSDDTRRPRGPHLTVAAKPAVAESCNRRDWRCPTPRDAAYAQMRSKTDTTAPTTPGRVQIASDRPPTRTALPETPEDRYDAPRIRCSLGNPRLNSLGGG